MRVTVHARARALQSHATPVHVPQQPPPPPPPPPPPRGVSDWAVFHWIRVARAVLNPAAALLRAADPMLEVDDD